MASDYLRTRELEQSSRSSRAKDGPEKPAALHPMLRLQQAAGNAAVARMLQRAAADEEEKEGGESESESDSDEAKDGGESEGAANEEEEKLQRKADGPEVGLAGGSLSNELAGRING